MLNATTRGFAAIGLHRPKDSLNVGSVLRAAHCYNAAMVAVAGHRYRRARTDVSGARQHIPYIEIEDLRTLLPKDCVPVAIDIICGATNLVSYVHPKSAFYIFGPEDGTLDEVITSWCRDVVYVPTTICMNLAAAVNVVLYDRAAKQQRIQHIPSLPK